MPEEWVGWLLTQGEYLARILIAALCGAAIGYERENRLKTAGIRTHIIVSIAAALMMVVSKYGFADVLEQPGMELDPSRIAAGVVTAIGFLGAGVIFVDKHNVTGLTTSAGIWATVGIGMSVGAGMYLMGISTALLIVLLQILLHKHIGLVKAPIVKVITFVLHSYDGADFWNRLTVKKGVEIVSVKSKRVGDTVEIRVTLRASESLSFAHVLSLFENDPNVISVEL